MKSWQRLGFTLVALVSLLLTSGLFAQDQNADNNPANDPPARVARIQYISGEVSMQPGGVNDWVAAAMNRPLTTSDRVWTDKDSRTELNVGDAFIRLNSESSLTLTNVSNNTVQLQLDQGTLELTVRHLEPGEIFEVDTPNLAFTVMKSGVYRIDVPPNDNQTWVTVRKGNGQATGQGPAVKVNSGEQVRFSGQGSLQNVAYAAPAPDGFEDWAQVRDKRLDSSVSARYVAPGVIGYEDLDNYGTWRVVAPYGAIWVPTNVAVGWAPYRYGHWVWINPWGWTWVDDAAWGFAPFHYGRWVSVGGYWGWAPGPAYVGWRPYYAPALVGWIGGANWGFGISVGFGGGCGWFPLGWGEPYYPWYHGYHGGYVSTAYIRNVNVTNTHITNINTVSNNYYHNSIQGTHYANRMVRGAVTAAPASALANGQNIARYGRAVPQSEVGRGQVVRNNDVTPTREAMLGGRAPLTAGVPPRSATDRSVVTHNAPPQSINRSAEAQNMPRSSEARNIPAAPASLGVHSPGNTGVNQAHTAAQPSQRNGNVTTEADAHYPNQTASPQHVVPRPPYAGGQAPRTEHNAAATTPYNPNRGSQSTARNEVPKPTYAGGHAPSSVSPAEHGGSSATQQQHPAATTHAPASQSSPATNHTQHPSQDRHESAPKSSSNPGTASLNVPRPPSGYRYQPTTAYAARSNASSGSYGSRSASPYTGNSYSGSTARSYNAAATPYVPGRSSYGSGAPSYHAAPSYGSHASAPAAPRYSAPSSYSGGGGSHATAGGGGGHSSSGGQGGGHHR
jgi:Family of unknown function (DUF6600)/FecR protein